jgi:hypothetical protein
MSEEPGVYHVQPFKTPLRQRKPQLDWQWTYNFEFVLTVPIKTTRGNGDYEIHIMPRPAYCDRGDWLILVECHNGDVDCADGFPRYFFGSADEVKVQMERWLERRAAYRDALVSQYKGRIKCESE